MEKAYALSYDPCNKTMKTRIEEIKDFHKRVQDDPIELLKEIKKKMYNPVKQTWEYITLTDMLGQLLETKQDDSENITDFTKRFKQVKDIAKETLGTKILDTFVETTYEYQKETDGMKKDKIKKRRFTNGELRSI